MSNSVILVGQLHLGKTECVIVYVTESRIVYCMIVLYDCIIWLYIVRVTDTAVRANFACDILTQNR